MTTTKGEWFSGYTLIFIILAFLSPFILVMGQPQPDPEDQDIELGEFPSFVNPELAQEQLSIPIPPHINSPPYAYIKPSFTRSWSSTCSPKQCSLVGPLGGVIVMDMPPEVHGLR
jgi:hypothetical protein